MGEYFVEDLTLPRSQLDQRPGEIALRQSTEGFYEVGDYLSLTLDVLRG